MQIKEGFFKSEEDEYNSLKSKIKSNMTAYCELSTFIEGRMKTIYMSNKFTDSGKSIPGESEAEANAHIQRTYKDVYSCTDELAKSRPSCKDILIQSIIFKGTPIKQSTDNHIPCSVFLNLPDYSEDNIVSIGLELSKIPDNLASIIAKELEWYVSVMDDLQKGQDAATNPPEQAPSGKQIEREIAAKKKEQEGFTNKCSPEAARLRREREKQETLNNSASTCTMPNISSEIARVSKLMQSNTLNNVLSNSKSLLTRAKKIQSDLDKLEAGTLYDWQQSDKGPRKSYATFNGGDRSASFVFSLQQNRRW